MTRSVKLLRRVAFLLILPCLIWSGYWAATAYALKKGVAIAGETQIPGLDAQFKLAALTGYPTRFDIGLTDILLSADNSLTWVTEGVTADAKSYAPNAITLDLSQAHRLSGTLGTIDIDAAQAAITLLVQPNLRLPLGHLTIEASALNLTAPNSWRAHITALLASFAPHPQTPQTYQISANVQALDLSDVLKHLPENYHVIQRVKVDGAVLLSGSLDRLVLENGLPEARQIAVQNAQFDFGSAQISIAGQLAYDTAKTATGTLNISVEGWQDLFQLAKDLGYVAPNLEGFFTTVLTDLDAQDGMENSLTIPLTIQNDKISYGALNFGVLR